MAEKLTTAVTPEDVLAYIAGVTAHPGYSARFAAELTTPGIRVPLTADPALWAEAVDAGKTILWLHTYGARFTDPDAGRPCRPPRLDTDRRPQVTATIPDNPDRMPQDISYDPATSTLHVGQGAISPVSQATWTYEVSGMNIIRKWFDYRKRTPRKRWSSPLDDITGSRWPPKYTTELLELINVLTMCNDLEPRQAALLEHICNGPLITISDLNTAHVLPAGDTARRPPLPQDPNTLTLDLDFCILDPSILVQRPAAFW